MLAREPPLRTLQILNEIEKHMCMFNMYLGRHLLYAHVLVVCTAVYILHKHVSHEEFRMMSVRKRRFPVHFWMASPMFGVSFKYLKWLSANCFNSKLLHKIEGGLRIKQDWINANTHHHHHLPTMDGWMDAAQTHFN